MSSPESVKVIVAFDSPFSHHAFDGPQLLPADPHERAMARFWARFIDDKCSKSFWLAMWTEGEAQHLYKKETKESLTLLEAYLEGKKFFGGDTIGLVDIGACGFSHWLGVCEEITGVNLFTHEEFPGLSRWAKEYTGDEKVRACLPDRAVLLKHFTANKEMLMAKAKSMLPK